MKINRITLHNFRSIKDASFRLGDYSLLVGENNSGKTTVLTALRMFYEESGTKFQRSKDFPKFETEDEESWAEIEFLTSQEEQETLRPEYKSPDQLLRVRRYFLSEGTNWVKSGQSNIYAYEKGSLSSNLFYGFKNVSQQKLGKVIYIPEVTKTDDTMKLSGPSPFRETINFIFTKIVRKSSSFQKLTTAFDEFNSLFSEEVSPDGYSIASFETDVNQNLEEWDISFGLRINPIKPADIIKTLLSYHIQDANLNNEQVDIGSFGQGLQRHLIYTLIRLSAEYVEEKEQKKKEFDPDFTLILFEEPEAFLHPAQQERLNRSLLALATEPEQQVLAATHSPIFVGKNVEHIKSIIRLDKQLGVSSIFQLSDDDFAGLMTDNISLLMCFSAILADTSADASLKACIAKKGLGEQNPDQDAKLEEEALKYFMWLDSERSCCFFARHIVICEGASEKVLLDYLVDNEWSDLRDRRLYFLNSMGKFNIHRYMNLFGRLGIPHSVLMDSDQSKNVHQVMNNFITSNMNACSRGLYSFPKDLEAFLGIPTVPKRDDLKPTNVLLNCKNGNVSAKTLDSLKGVVLGLL